MDPSGKLNNILKTSSSLPAGRTHHNPTPPSAEDDEIPLDCSSEDSHSSDISMSGSDSDDEASPLISTGNERLPIQPLFSAFPATLVPTVEQDPAMSRKRKLVEGIDTPGCIVISSKKVKLDREGYEQPPSTATYPSDKSLLPAEIWHRIFSFTPPRALGNLLCTNKLFNVYLDPSSRYQCKSPLLHSRTSVPLLKPDAIWQVSRRRFWPRMPAPLKEKTELDMWRLACGKKCQYCNKAGSVPSNSPDSPQRNNTQPVWAFAIHSCGPCLVEKTIKEIDLLLSSSIPSLLMSALPFVLVTNEMHMISPDTLRKGLAQPDLQVTKIYLPEQVERLKQEFLSVKSMGGATAEEWLKGLETRGKELFSDLMRWEKWMTTGGVTQMRTQLSSDSISIVAIPNNKGPASVNVSLSAPKSHSNSTNTPKQHTPDPCYVAPIATTSQPTYAPLGTDLQHNSTAPVQPPIKHSNQTNAPRARTREEALELKAARRAEIERRAMELDPPLPANILAHILSFQAAIQIISPLDDNAWEMLKPRLLAQRADAEQLEKREETASQSRIVPERSEGRRHTEENSIAAKQLIDKTWDDIQAPLRARISAYADEIIRGSWDDGRKVDAGNSPQFAVEVLLHVRRRFYTEIAKESVEARAAGQVPAEDPPEGPFTKRLTLENMKWLFDVKIKTRTESHRKDLFFCNGCDVNFKAFGFEGVIQHYAAKHSNSLSLGSVVVHWRAEWPETPPFRSDARTVKAEQPSSRSSYGPLQPPNYAALHHHNASVYSASNPASFQPPPYFTAPLPGCGLSMYGSTAQQLAPYGPGHSYISGHHDYSSSHALPPSPYDPRAAAYSSSEFSFSGIHGRPPAYPSTDVSYGYNFDAPQDNPQVNFQASHSNPLAGKYHAQLGYLARSSRELWTSTAGLKELPGEIRVCVVIYHVVQRFRSRFFESPPLTMFIDGLANNKEMRPVRNVNGLMCKACCLSLNGGTLAGQGSRTFSLPQLVNHFQQAHVDQPQMPASLSLDWTINMVHTPDLSVLTKLRNLTNMDSQKFLLISNAFPPAPHLDDYSQGMTTDRIQSAGPDPVTTYAGQSPTHSNLIPQSSSAYEHASLCVAIRHNSVAPRRQDATRASISGQKLSPSQAASSSTPTLTNYQRFPQDDSGRESSETWQGPCGIRSRKQKGNHPRDHRSTPSQGLKNRKGGVAAASNKAKSQEPNEGDLIAEEDRRQEEEIRAMWAADRREAARFASQNQHLNKAEESDSPIVALEAEDRRSAYTQATRIIRSPTYSIRNQSHEQPVAGQEREEDDLMAGLESQLDLQQVPSKYVDYRPKPTDEVDHEEPSYGRYASSGHHHHSQRYSYDQIRPGSPIYVRHGPGHHFSEYRESPSSHHTDLPTQATTIRDDTTYDQPPRQEHYHAYTDDMRLRRPTPEHAETYELIRMRDFQGEYFIRRPIKLEREPTYQDGHAPYRDSTLQYRSYENNEYSSSRLGLEPVPGIDTHLRQPHEVGVGPVDLRRRSHEPLPRGDLAGYEDYDPRYPAAPPGSSISQQLRYRWP
ncbi:uncharacterized protein F4807DRAFT_406424 [Annulohypoxylon truncatum]|uniref:uncharacterized protein n=1 Tax=Annulohypoxylon truncatum TaxID=327061 RepID=UPI00200722CC|nr:uncharacterized protein F4807DRAFT_406424 [Annulohypoxylon truncatum]KAI1214033.1 hypothetical protein F4807DRAFT_406424 [Annulohypoxylon truncatum]